MASEEVEAFLPTLAKARAAKASLRARVWWRRSGVDLLRREPVRTEKVAALWAVVRQPGQEEPLLRYPYVPSMPFPLEEGAARLFERQEGEPPECLRVDVERRGSGDPYRGSPAARPSFHEHDYGDALAQARGRLGSLREAHGAKLDVRTYAWPILRLSYRSFALRREVAILVRPDGVMHAMLCRGAWR